MEVMHILQELGILTSFHIRQKMTSDEFLHLYKSIEQVAHSKDEIKSLLEQKSSEDIPGNILPSKEELRLKELVMQGNLLAQFIQRRPMPKEELVFLLTVIAKNLGISVTQ